jgi:hypothetical protein
VPSIRGWRKVRREKRDQEKCTAGVTLSEKVSSVRVMTSALERAVRTTRTVSDTSKRWIGRRRRTGAPRSMASTDGDDSDGEGGRGERRGGGGEVKSTATAWHLLGCYGPLDTLPSSREFLGLRMFPWVQPRSPSFSWFSADCVVPCVCQSVYLLYFVGVY